MPRVIHRRRAAMVSGAMLHADHEVSIYEARNTSRDSTAVDQKTTGLTFSSAGGIGIGLRPQTCARTLEVSTDTASATHIGIAAAAHAPGRGA